MKYLFLGFVLLFEINLITGQNFTGSYLVQTDKEYNSDSLAEIFGVSKNKIRTIFPELNIFSVIYDFKEGNLSYRSSNNRHITSIETDSPLDYRKIPNDPFFTNQYYLSTINADKVWEINTGASTVSGDEIVVAVLDFGIDINHPDLKDNMWKNKGEIAGDHKDNDNNGYVDDYSGLDMINYNDNLNVHTHGTSVCGIIGATGNNSKGVSGINWKIKILPITSVGSKSQLIEAYNYIYELRKKYNETNGLGGAFVVCTNLSAGFSGEFASENTTLCSIYDKLGEVGILSVSSADNIGENLEEVGDIPTLCTSDFIIPVTSTDKNDNFDTNRGYGKTSVDIAAPGEEIYTTVLNNGYANFSGNSAAAPIVAGAIGLIYTLPCDKFMQLVKENPKTASQNVKNYLLNYSTPKSDLKNITVSGGRLDIYNTYIHLIELCGGSQLAKLNIVSLTQSTDFNSLNVKYEVENFDILNLSVYNAVGQLFFKTSFPPDVFGDKEKNINIANLPIGVYIVSLSNGSNQISKSALIVR